MAVTSSTLGGVNVWQFSGAVTDAEIKTAWSGLITNGVYVLNRAIYLDNTVDLTAVSGGFLTDLGTQVNPGIILHTGRDKTKSVFKNFTFLQRTGLQVVDRSRFVMTWNGTSLSTPIGADGLSLNGGGMIYGVPGAPVAADPRFLNEMSFASLEGATIYSQEFTEQELQIVIGQSTVLRRVSFEKCFGFPQIGTPVSNVNVVAYGCNMNTQHPTQQPIRLFPSDGRWASVCYVDSYTTRNSEDITANLGAWFNSSATNRAVCMILNNYTREGWFGASKATMVSQGNWNAANQFWGGVLKKLEFVDGAGGVVRTYDSRSTTAAQKCKFQETGFVDFLDTTLAPTTDAQGRISLVHIGALATGAGPTPAITRYTDQKYTFQKFGKRVRVDVPDMTKGDNDLSAFLPVVLTPQLGIARTEAAINAATTVETFQDLLEELHVLSLNLIGSDSYNAAFGGNLFDLSGTELRTSFTSVTLDPAAASKIVYDSTTNALTIRATTLIETTAVNRWANVTGDIAPPVGEQVEGLYESSIGPNTRVRFTNLV